MEILRENQGNAENGISPKVFFNPFHLPTGEQYSSHL